MARYGMVIDLNKCIGCGACVMACIAENRREQALKAVSEGLKALENFKKRTYITTHIAGTYPNVGMYYLHMICQHCENPPCVSVCPTGASYQTKEGVVLVDKSKCIGCEYCVQACPYGARFWDSYIRSIDKCTFCIHRVSAGELPACVSTCPTGARMFGDLDNPASEVSRVVATGSAVAFKKEEGTKPKVFYVLPMRRR
ncbi:4Fe-4S dicluster domain-containing protein [Infirmifilum lucidum]|uniref:4Fe-4S dicluster domain-containing protein n=1 Tax=Infirmifilum lucidum TaxID=2776706 RepID=A0A7L9FGB4_9CREN|nr:4Fe-4S dicluster domain-containing protein [Infirmifilum lucidum]QOJ78858.1 4Fe-4S dicluster domain-containing protein [Infirmifilum lucidum]